MKKIPEMPPLPAFSSALLAQLLGKVSSNAPKKDIAKTIKITKNNKLEIADVAIVYKILSPKMSVRINVGMV